MLIRNKNTLSWLTSQAGRGDNISISVSIRNPFHHDQKRRIIFKQKNITELPRDNLVSTVHPFLFLSTQVLWGYQLFQILSGPARFVQYQPFPNPYFFGLPPYP